MKLGIFTIISSILLFSCNPNTEIKNSLSERNLRGNVKQYTEATYVAVEKFGKVEKGQIQNFSFIEIEIFDSTGYLTQSKTLTDDNKLFNKGLPSYNSNNRLQELKIYSPSDELDYRIIYTYDESDNKIEESSYRSDGSLDDKWIYINDSKGRKKEQNIYNSNGELMTKTTFSNDNDGNCVEQIVYDRNGSFESKTIFEYDKMGNMIMEDHENPMIEKTYLTPKFIYKYEFDSYENWIKRIQYIDQTPMEITIRDFQYYN